MKKLILAIAFLIMGCNGCTGENIPRPAPVEPTDTDYCKPGCDHLMTLKGQDDQMGCLEARPLPLPDGGELSCEAFCTETQKKGRALSPKCWLEVTECSAIETQCRR